MAMIENKGLLKTWKDDRGFGFIKPEDGSDDIFIHISALKSSVRRPYRGDTIFYEVEHGNEGKSKAVNARIDGVEAHVEKGESNKWVWIIASILGLLSAGALAFFGMLQF